MDDQKARELAQNIFEISMIFRQKMLKTKHECLEKSALKERFGSLTLNQLAIFMMVAGEQGDLTITDLARLLNVSAPSVSVFVDKLVEEGILLRRPCKTDRRKVMVKLSGEGERLAMHYHQAMTQAFANLLQLLGEEVGGMLVKSMEKVWDVKEDWLISKVTAC